jgi:hypothetical protein
MSEERFEPETDEDVEAHGHKAARKTAATDEPSDESEDVEAHGHKAAVNQEPDSDDESDDVEAHARRASHKAI